jgi:hypothetical protein
MARSYQALAARNHHSAQGARVVHDSHRPHVVLADTQ